VLSPFSTSHPLRLAFVPSSISGQILNYAVMTFEEAGQLELAHRYNEELIHMTESSENRAMLDARRKRLAAALSAVDCSSL
jgi:hypothetical protein